MEMLLALPQNSHEGNQDSKQASRQTATKERMAGGDSDAKANLIPVKEGVQK